LAFQTVGDFIKHANSELAHEDRGQSLFAYGGNGGLFACGVAEQAGLDRVYFFSLGPAFSAFGSCVSDLSHVYERAPQVSSISDGAVADLNRILDDIRSESSRDLLGQGIKPERIAYSIELEMACPGKPTIAAAYPGESFRDIQSFRSFCEGVSGMGTDKIRIELIRVQIRKPMPKPAVVHKPLAGADPSHARKGARKVAWGSSQGEAQLFHWEALQPGNRVAGCAVLEAANSTYFVPEGWTLTVDTYGNAQLNRG